MVKHAEANVIGPIDYYPQMVGWDKKDFKKFPM